MSRVESEHRQAAEESAELKASAAEESAEIRNAEPSGTARLHPSKLWVHSGWPLPLGAKAREGGVHFALYSRHATRVWLVLYNDIDDLEPAIEIALDPEQHRFGDIWSAFIKGLEPGTLYAYRIDGPNRPGQGYRYDPGRTLLDPYATCLVGDIQRGHGKCVVPPAAIPHVDTWPRVPLHETIIYEVHLAGLTKHPSSGVEHPGTYRGFIEKIPYLKELGVTAVELLPIQQTGKRALDRVNPQTGELLYNYWCYDPIGFFAPMGHYASGGGRGEQVEEFRELVRALHDAGIEVILDVVFNHTAEGEFRMPMLSFKGIENPTYYHVGPDGCYRDFTGCQNTVNCNHPIVQDLIVDCLRHWVLNMQVDGFRFDLATVLMRDCDGRVMDASPLVQRIGEDPVLRRAKLIAEPWDAAGGYQTGRFGGRRWLEWNDKYRDHVRAFWVGNNEAKAAFAERLIGSPDLYEYSGRSALNSVNFITAHDGFTLRDYVSYNVKHNEANGENNRDGSDFNQSWNFGVEGETDDIRINAMRLRMQKNLLATLFFSVGVPMMLGGDEFGRTQKGNNNAYCQDNEISWFDWTLLERNAELFRFCKEVIRFRRENLFFTRSTFPRAEEGVPAHKGADCDVLWLNAAGAPQDWSTRDPSLAMWVNADANGGTYLFVAFNTSLEPIQYRLPEGQRWLLRVNTAKPMPDDFVSVERAPHLHGRRHIRVAPKAMVVLAAPASR
jgi:isoamylase